MFKEENRWYSLLVVMHMSIKSVNMVKNIWSKWLIEVEHDVSCYGLVYKGCAYSRTRSSLYQPPLLTPTATQCRFAQEKPFSPIFCLFWPSWSLVWNAVISCHIWKGRKFIWEWFWGVLTENTGTKIQQSFRNHFCPNLAGATFLGEATLYGSERRIGLGDWF